MFIHLCHLRTPHYLCIFIILTVNSSVEGGGISGLAQRSPVSQENALLSAVITQGDTKNGNF